MKRPLDPTTKLIDKHIRLLNFSGLKNGAKCSHLLDLEGIRKSIKPISLTVSYQLRTFFMKWIPEARRRMNKTRRDEIMLGETCRNPALKDKLRT